ncbi:glucokinase [Edwardsiella ictaluri]|uniref:glucokinase n=1 Tax=Edwardsiella ictaluri TaxID=67780 RepID=UPI0036D25F8E
MGIDVIRINSVLLAALKAYLAPIPVFLIVHDNPGLLGAGAYLRQHLGARL